MQQCMHPIECAGVFDWPEPEFGTSNAPPRTQWDMLGNGCVLAVERPSKVVEKRGHGQPLQAQASEPLTRSGHHHVLLGDPVRSTKYGVRLGKDKGKTTLSRPRNAWRHGRGRNKMKHRPVQVHDAPVMAVCISTQAMCTLQGKRT
ncbi:hypothetical protein X797_000305 [Metarhizium robertsii]|uniref:Uncharacterized protein n=1 Tax=Metarhizium robertsii TaxID=568076 RepID=A0A0A1V6V8_9HYPO|nr:hypothetical protein X797_000305 [Metarhizium robertsii]